MRQIVSGAAATLLLLCGPGGYGDETVYQDGEETLREANQKMYGTIVNKPYAEKFPNASVIKDNQWFHVDISSACNMGFEDEAADDNRGGWTDSGPVSDLHPFGPGYGVVKFYGIPFNIIDPAKNNALSMVTMRSGWKTHDHFPEQVKFTVGRKSSTFYFFHGSSWATTSRGMGAARNYEVIYEDGTNCVIPVVCAGGHENIANWMWSPSSGIPLLDTSSAKPVPVKIDKDIRYLFVLEWKNPYPEKVVREIWTKTKNDGLWFTVVVLGITGITPN